MSAMMLQQVQQIISIRGIVFAQGQGKGRAKLSQRGRVDGIKHQKVILHQRVNQRAARLLKTNSQAPAPKALLQTEGPLLQDGRTVFDYGLFSFAGTGIVKTNGV